LRNNARSNLWLLARSAILVLLLAHAGDAAPAKVAEPLVLVYEGNRLSVKPSVTVPYSDLGSMVAALQSALSSEQYAILLFRESPRETVGYVLAVEREGTLSLGGQQHEWDASDGRYRFLRGELYRSYQPLEGHMPWTWLVTIPISRELQASLMIRAAEAAWPVQTVLISVRTQPTQ